MSEAPKQSMREMLAIPLGTLGAILGGVVGGFLFHIILKSYGFYMPLLVGGLVGFAAVGFARRGGVILAVIALVVALVATVLTPWMAQAAPREDLGDFIQGILNLAMRFKVLLGLSPVLAFIIVMYTPAKPVKKSEP